MKNNNKSIFEKMAVVIIGRNEGTRLKCCLLSVLKSGANNYIYVDSHSSDESVKIAKELGFNVIELDNKKPLSAARARNEGFKWLDKNISEIKYIHFIDGDCELDQGWLEKAYDALESDNGIAVLCGRLREKNRDLSLYNRLCDISWYIKPGEVNSGGGIATIRANVFKEKSGFNESLIAGEEPEFYYRIKKADHKIICLDEDMGIHDAAMTHYSAWFTRSFRTGFSYANAAKWGLKNKARRSLVIWGGFLPLLIILLAAINPLAINVLIIIFILQIIKVYLNLDIPYSKGDRFLFSCFCMFDKFPEFLGFLKYQYVNMSGVKHDLIEYKNNQKK